MRTLSHTGLPVVLLLACSWLSNDLLAQPQESVLRATVKGTRLRIEADLPRSVRQVELRVASDRNANITRFSTISPHDIDHERRRERYDRTDHETWFPVVDVRVERGMEAVCVLSGELRGGFTFGGPYFDDERPLQQQIVVSSNRLEPWENSLRVASKSINFDAFYLRKTYPLLLHEFRHDIELFSQDWSGTVSLFDRTRDGATKLAEQHVRPNRREWHHEELASLKGSGASPQRLKVALHAIIEEALRRQNVDPDSPTYGSFHTFYDMEARLHRSAYWLWGGSPYVKLIVDALENDYVSDGLDRAELLDRVDRVGQLYLKYQVRDVDHPSTGAFLVIWTRTPAGYTKWVGTSDSGIMHKWVVLPLYRATGNAAYLESAEFWCKQKGRLLEQHEILPHYFLYDENRFADRILDETGWDPEGHAALYELTGNAEYKQIAHAYMQKHMARFQNDDGFWNRTYVISEGRGIPPSHMTRGSGWFMEGFLAMNSMFPDGVYLEYAKKVASTIAEHQNEDGSWNFVFDAPAGSGLDTPSDKATPLWSFLFYRLYRATGNKSHLQTARKALIWCLDHQYTGPDPEAIGGLVGRTNASMVGYRYYYDATCAYASGFFGLAILEELRQLETGSS